MVGNPLVEMSSSSYKLLSLPIPASMTPSKVTRKGDGIEDDSHLCQTCGMEPVVDEGAIYTARSPWQGGNPCATPTVG